MAALVHNRRVQYYEPRIGAEGRLIIRLLSKYGAGSRQRQT
jgi:hypothetical protein